MRNIAICGSGVQAYQAQVDFLETIFIDNMPVTCGQICTTDPAFDATSPEHRRKVLVRIKAFSCNFRDKTLILSTAIRVNDSTYFRPIGSDFAGEVVDVGCEIDDFAPGDRVIGDSRWSGLGLDTSAADGIQTNHASKEYQIFNPDRLVKVPPAMPDEVADAFGIGAQTAYSILRKLDIKRSSNILVTAARSNTALFVMSALSKYEANIYAISTATTAKSALKQIGVQDVIRVLPAESDLQVRFSKILAVIGGFDCVIDPFFNLHLSRVIPLLAPGGKYITCGLNPQLPFSTNAGVANEDFERAMIQVIINNLHIIGNCLGTTEDLVSALEDYQQRQFTVLIDSVFRSNTIGAFLDRTYNSKERWGKVVYRYD